MQVMRNGVRVDYRPVQHHFTPTNTYVVFMDGEVVADYAVDLHAPGQYGSDTAYAHAMHDAIQAGGEVASRVWPLTPAR